MSTVIPMIRSREAPRGLRSKMDTLLLSRDEINKWKVPPFQRPLRVNPKVQALAEQLRADGGVIPGVITLGRLMPDKTLFIVDGQHRIGGFEISALSECIADVRIVDFDDLADMADEFVKLNSALVKMRPDDILRGLEGSLAPLGKIRREVSFVGYDNIRRGTSSPIVGMSALLRCWNGSVTETPGGMAGMSSAEMARSLDDAAAKHIIRFLLIAEEAWGRDPEYYRLWGNLNLTLCLWIYRRLVIDNDRRTLRYVVLSHDQFRKCLMSVSADRNYLDWLAGRLMNDRDRSPGYGRLKAIFQARLRQDSRDQSKKPILPAPAWASK